MITTSKLILKKPQHLIIPELADKITSQWTQYLSLYPYLMPEDLGYVEGSLAGEKLVIENQCYQTAHFRKLHLEIAKIGNNLEILHCVMFPRTDYSLPIFGVDLVASKGKIGAAIVDLSPISPDLDGLSLNYQSALSDLPKIGFSEPRQLPEWGNIFSKFCLFVRPVNEIEIALFLYRVEEILNLHCQIATATKSVSSTREKIRIHQQQRFYCQQQQRNDKTRKILEKALGKVWTDRYMTEMLFDCV